MDRFIVKTASGTDVEKTFKIQYGQIYSADLSNSDNITIFI